MKIYDRDRHASESAIGWALATGRIKPDDAAEWEASPVLAEKILPRLAASSAVLMTPAGRPVPDSVLSLPGAAPASGQRPAAAKVPAGVDPRWYARNPALDTMALRNTAVAQAVKANNSDIPTLFDSGDLPPFTASGIDPNLLANVPWTARHRIAEEPNRAKAMDLIESVSGAAGLDYAHMEFRHDGANRTYMSRVEHWAAGIAVAADRRAYERDLSVAAAQRTGAAKPTHAMNGDEIYDAVFGEIERQEDARVDAYRSSAKAGNVTGAFGSQGGVKRSERAPR